MTTERESLRQAFWANPQAWPPDYPERTFLARALHQVGSVMFGSDWIGSEPITQLLDPNLNRARMEASLRASIRDVDFDGEAARAKANSADADGALERYTRALGRLHMLINTGRVSTAIQQHPLGGRFIELPADQWSTLATYDWFTKCKMDPANPFGGAADGPNHRWLYVGFRSLQRALGLPPNYPNEIVDIAPTEAAQTSTEVPIVEVSRGRSGAPGRPTSMHLVEMEFRRRLGEGEADPSNVQEASILASWLSEAHPAEPQLKPKSIRNRIGPLRRKIQGAQN